MPVLLDLARAPTLEALLSAANTQGMDWRISAPAGADPLRVRGIGTLASASGQEISFLANPKYQSQLAATQAGAVIVSADVAETLEAAGADRPRFALVVCKHPYLLYARVAQWFDAARRPALPAATHPSAVVAADAHIEDDVRIGPNCVIESGARIGRGSVLGAGCVIGAGSSIGPDSRLHAHVTLYEGVKVGARAIIHSGVVLGADGFGFAPDPSLGQGAWGKIPQLGGVSV
uniref:UDP-3-O-(3-hydroxymyristoyl)glucosamine N-acyltransferase n=13 Tax=Alcaligenaceae TaxID=506 RepID=UPI001F140635